MLVVNGILITVVVMGLDPKPGQVIIMNSGFPQSFIRQKLSTVESSLISE